MSNGLWRGQAFGGGGNYGVGLLVGFGRPAAGSPSSNLKICNACSVLALSFLRCSGVAAGASFIGDGDLVLGARVFEEMRVSGTVLDLSILRCSGAFVGASFIGDGSLVLGARAFVGADDGFAQTEGVMKRVAVASGTAGTLKSSGGRTFARDFVSSGLAFLAGGVSRRELAGGPSGGAGRAALRRAIPFRSCRSRTCQPPRRLCRGRSPVRSRLALAVVSLALAAGFCLPAVNEPTCC